MMESAGIEEIVSAGLEAWSSLPIAAEALRGHVAQLSDRHGPPLPRYAADIALAYACGVGARGALEAFDAQYGAALTRAAERVAKSNALVDEAVQIVRMRLFAEAPPKIFDYGGRARLSTWVATAAARSTLNLGARSAERAAEELRTDAHLARANPELDIVRAKLSKELEPCIALAVATLTEKERALLRLHLVERMGIDDLARTYRVGRSTTARWLAAARASLLAQVRRALCERLGMTPSELLSAGADLQSSLDVSVLKLL